MKRILVVGGSLAGHQAVKCLRGLGYDGDLTTSARPDLQAHHDAMRLEPAVLVKELRDVLGAKLVAYLGGVKETCAVRQWAEGTRAVSGGDDLHRLRIAYQAARLLGERDTSEVVQAWFQGLNPALGDGSPARLLREGDVDDVGAQVLAAARQLAAVG